MWSLVKRPGNTIILLITCLVICTFVLSSLSIQSGVNKSNEWAREQLGAEVILKYDLIRALLNKPRGQGITLDEFQEVPATIADQFISLPHVVGYNYFNIHFMIAKDFNFIPPANGANEEADTPNTSVHEVLDTAQYKRFSDGTDKLIAGRHLNANDRGELNAVIEKHLAEANELKINDTITIATNDEEEFTFNIVGIYESSLYVQDAGVDTAIQVVSNKIYTSFGGMANHASIPTEQVMSRGYYYLDDPKHIDTFVKMAEESGIIDINIFHFSANEKSYNEMTGAISQVASISRIIQLLVMGAGTIILSLILILSVRSRIREIGILISIGESRLKVVSQLLTEMLVILIIAFNLSLFAGQLIAQKLGDVLINQQVNAVQMKKDLLPDSGIYSNDIAIDANDPTETYEFDQIQEIDIKITTNQLITLALIGLGIGIIAVLLPSMAILRLKPREILLKT